MPTTTIPAQPTWLERFAVNAENQLKAGSTWLTIALVPVFVAMAQVPGFAEAINKIPGLAGYGAVVASLIAILAAKFRPSSATSTQSQLLAAEVARLTINKQLSARGLPEIPPPATPLPMPGNIIVPILPPVPEPDPVADIPLQIQRAPPAPPAPVAPPPLAPMLDPDAIAALRAVEPSVSDEALVLALKVLRLNRRAIVS